MCARMPVTYATRYGSTEEVVEAVVETLRKNGFEVDARPTRVRSAPSSTSFPAPSSWMLSPGSMTRRSPFPWPWPSWLPLPCSG